MKLKSYNTTNTSGRTSKALISISKTGLFRFSKGAIDVLGIKAGDQVQFLQDEEDPENWYLEIVKKDGFPLRESYNADLSGLLTNASGVRHHLFNSVAYLGAQGRVYIGEQIENQKRTFYALITGFLRNT